MSSRQLGACQFIDDDQLCALETALVQLGGRECVVAAAPSGGVSGAAGDGVGMVAQGADARRLADVLARCHVMSTARPKAVFSAKHLEADLATLLKVWASRVGAGWKPFELPSSFLLLPFELPSSFLLNCPPLSF
eukprot:365029-Chlamydomonas_euryale.AAC.19